MCVCQIFIIKPRNKKKSQNIYKKIFRNIHVFSVAINKMIDTRDIFHVIWTSTFGTKCQGSRSHYVLHEYCKHIFIVNTLYIFE